MQPDARILAKLTRYRGDYPELMARVGRTEAPLIRRYIDESDIGNLFADIFVATSGADIAFVHSGGLRKDMPAGDILLVDILDAYPFVDDLNVKEMSGDQIRRALEQSFTLERGLLQVSGLSVTYDLTLAEGERLISLQRNGVAVADDDLLLVAAPGFLAEGGDLYIVFAESDAIRNAGKVSDAAVAYFADHDVVAVPSRGRQVDIGR